MSRKTENYKVIDEGRDCGKVFVLTEMPASRAEAWAMRALFALLANNADIPPGIASMGMAGMAQIGIKALSGLRWEVAEPLLAEMWSCVQIMPDPSKPHIVRPLIEEDIEELMTRVKLRAEVWKLHAGFLKAVAPSILANFQAAAATPKASRNTKTSRRQLPL
jgi:hypothetical protein